MKDTLPKSKAFAHQARRHSDKMFATLYRQQSTRPGPFASSSCDLATECVEVAREGGRGFGRAPRNQQPERRVTAIGPKVGNVTPRRKGEGAPWMLL